MSGSLGYEWIDAQTFADFGVDAVKYDDCASELYAQVLQDAPRRFPFNPPAVLKFPIMVRTDDTVVVGRHHPLHGQTDNCASAVPPAACCVPIGRLPLADLSMQGLALNKTGRNISYMCNFPWEFWTRDWPAKGGGWVSELCNSWRTGSDARAGFDGMLQAVHFAETFADQVPSGPGGWNHLDAMQIGNNRSYFAHAEQGRAAAAAAVTTGLDADGPGPGPPFPGTPMTEAQEQTNPHESAACAIGAASLVGLLFRPRIARRRYRYENL